MPNHYHLLVQTLDGDLSRPMKALNGRYALRFNRRHGRDAHLFKNRFGAVLQDSDAQLLQTIRYITRNPIEAGLCAQPEEWPWSTYRAVVGLDDRPTFVDIAGLLAYFGDEAGGATAGFRSLIDGSLGV